MLASTVGNPIGGAGVSAYSPFMSAVAPIGGTSGGTPGQGGGANVLSMNIGGVNVNYDIGPSTADMATQAYNFLGNSFNADSALLGSTIVGANKFVSGFATPVLAMAQQQEDFNTTVLPSMFGTLSAQNYSLGSQAIAAETSVAQSNIEASSAATQSASSGGGGCYITTAVCERRGEKDDCETLTKLRSFRDSYMMQDKNRKGLVWLYYQTAPKMVRAIKTRPDADAFLDALFDKYIAPACAAIDRGDNLAAFTIYTQMLFDVREEIA